MKSRGRSSLKLPFLVVARSELLHGRHAVRYRPFVGIYLQQQSWIRGVMGTAMTVGTAGDVAGWRDHRCDALQAGIDDRAGLQRGGGIGIDTRLAESLRPYDLTDRQLGSWLSDAVAGITPGIVGQKGFNRRNGRNKASNHAGNMVGAAISGYVGWQFGYFAVFALAAVFGAISVVCVLTIPAASIDLAASRGIAQEAPRQASRVLIMCVSSTRRSYCWQRPSLPFILATRQSSRFNRI
jgi:hypothetical protein